MEDNRPQSVAQRKLVESIGQAGNAVLQPMMRGGRGGGHAGRGGRGGRGGGGRGRVVPDVGPKYSALNWDDQSAITEEESPYISAIRRGASGSNPARFSLACSVSDPETGEDTDPLGRAISLSEGNKDLGSQSSCHPTAEHLVRTLGNGPVTSVGNFVNSAASPINPENLVEQEAHEDLAATLTSIGKEELAPQVIRYTHGAHSFTLFASKDRVESVEAWAGGAEEEKDAEDLNTNLSYPLHKSVKNPKPSVPIDEAIRLAGQLGHQRKANRKEALDAFSNAGIDGFEKSGQRLKNIPRSLDRRAALSPEDVEGQIRARIERADRDLDGAEAVIEQPERRKRNRSSRSDEKEEAPVRERSESNERPRARARIEVPAERRGRGRGSNARGGRGNNARGGRGRGGNQRGGRGRGNNARGGRGRGGNQRGGRRGGRGRGRGQ